MPTEVPLEIPNTDIAPHSNRVQTLLISARENIPGWIPRVYRHPLRSALGLSLLVVGIGTPASSAFAQEDENGGGITTVAGPTADIAETEGEVASAGTDDPPLPDQGPTETAAALDILSFPSWSTNFSGVISVNENGLSITNRLGSTELTVPNNIDSIPVGPNGFEMSVKMSTESNPNPIIPGTGTVLLYNGNPREPGTSRVEIGLTNRNYLIVSILESGMSSPQVIYTPQIGFRITRVDSGELNVRISNNSGQESLSIVDGATGDNIELGIALPFAFSSRPLYVGFYVGSGSREQTATTTIDRLEANSLA